MSILDKKIDFVMFFTVNNANPNGDPLMGNMPRTDYDGFGEVSDVCIKRKIRNRMQDLEHDIFVQSQDRAIDEHKSLETRFNEVFPDKKISDDIVAKDSCERWLDVRSFGQVMTFQKRSLGIRGPVSISLAKSLSPVDVITMQITRSANAMKSEVGKRSSDTMGSKHFVEFGVYKLSGSINCYFAEKTGFTNTDASIIKESLRTLFVNDMSSARPEGSMEVKKLYWFEHNSKLGIASSAKIHNLIQAKVKEDIKKVKSYDDYEISIDNERYNSYKQAGLNLEEIEGI